jgi:hypothetical protein
LSVQSASGFAFTKPNFSSHSTLVAVEPCLLFEADVVVALELEAVTGGEAVARLVGLLEENVGIEVEDPGPRFYLVEHVEHDRLFLLERAGDVEAWMEVLDHPAKRVFRAEWLELGGDPVELFRRPDLGLSIQGW